jgi:hypothetical protein
MEPVVPALAVLRLVPVVDRRRRAVVPRLDPCRLVRERVEPGRGGRLERLKIFT